jgi:glutathione S-transferase
MLTIFGHPMSTCTRKVLTTVNELGMPHELVLVDFAKGEHKQEPHLSRQPFGRVPAIDHDGFALYESRAICSYLNDVAGGSLVPGDAQARARMQQWISVEYSYFTGATMKFIYHHVFQRKQDDDTLATARAGFDQAMGIMDKALAQQPYFAGEAFSLAEVAFMPYVEYSFATPLKDAYEHYPNVAAWWARVSERPSWRKVTGKG